MTATTSFLKDEKSIDLLLFFGAVIDIADDAVFLQCLNARCTDVIEVPFANLLGILNHIPRWRSSSLMPPPGLSRSAAEEPK